MQTIRLNRVSDGVYEYTPPAVLKPRGFTLPKSYRATRRKWCAPSVCTSWDLVTPSGDKIECDTLREVREFIAEDVKA